MLSCISSVINRRRLLCLRSKALVSIWKMPMKYFSNRLLFPQLYSVQEHQSIEKHKGTIMTPDLCNIIYIPHICATQVIINNFPCQTRFLLAFFTERPRKKSHTKSLTLLQSSLSCFRARKTFLDLILLVNKTLLKFNNKWMVQVSFFPPSLSHTDLYRSKRTTFDISWKIKKHNLAISNQWPHATALELLNSFQTQMSHKHASYSSSNNK